MKQTKNDKACYKIIQKLDMRKYNCFHEDKHEVNKFNLTKVQI